MERVSVPVHFYNASNGLEHANGVLAVEADALVLDVQVSNAMLFMQKPEPRMVRMAYDDIAEVSFKAGLFANTLSVRVHSLQAFGDLSFGNGPVLRMSVAKDDRALADELVATVMLRLSERRLRRELGGNGGMDA